MTGTTSPRRAKTITIQPESERAARPSDEVLVGAVAAGKSHAFDVLVGRYGARVNAYLRHLLGDAAWAEDLTQDVFVKVYCNIDSREPGRSFPVWLFRIARNEALDFMRRRSVHRRALHSFLHGLGEMARGLVPRREPSPLAELEAAEVSLALENALGELPEPQRSIFVLREREELSYEEIGAVVGCTAKTVSTRLHRARRRLRDLLGDLLDDRPNRGGEA